MDVYHCRMSVKHDPIDIHVGQRLRLRRVALGLSQEKLGDAIGVSFQMVQKYERGDCRVSASRLMNAAQVLGVTVAYFFEGSNKAPASKALKAAETQNGLDEAVFEKKETIELLKAYYALPDSMRKNVMGMVKGMVK